MLNFDSTIHITKHKYSLASKQQLFYVLTYAYTIYDMYKIHVLDQRTDVAWYYSNIELYVTHCSGGYQKYFQQMSSSANKSLSKVT